MLDDYLKLLPPAHWREIRRRLERSVDDLGLAFAPPKSPRRQQMVHSWGIAPVPVLLNSDEWATLTAAVRQRVRLLNALFADLYGPREVLRHRILPPELVMRDPFFRRACVGMTGAANQQISVFRFDLYRSRRHGWVILANYTNTPIGMSFAVQNRRLLTQEAPDLYAGIPDYERVIDFPLQLLDTLKRLSPRPSATPHIVVLTSGPDDPAYFEHSFVARKMGLPLVQGDDLLVVDNRVYFKTIAGLEQVDVIYRRLNDAHIDPVAFDTPRFAAGVPGLLGCLRAGTVAVANPVGAGVIENRALSAYLGRLCRHFLAEPLLLPGDPVWYCGEVDHLDHVVDSAPELLIAPVHTGPFDPAPLEPGSSPTRIRRYLKDVFRAPHHYIARSPLDPLPHPNPRGYGMGEVGTIVSCFAVTRNGRTEIMAGGLGRLMPLDRPIPPAPWQIGQTVDVIVDRSADPTQPGQEAPLPVRARAHLLGSAAAERLYWTGRYAERGEACARMLSIVEDVGLEDLARTERPRWFPVWMGILEATGHLGDDSGPVIERLTGPVAWSMVLDPSNPNSLASSVRSTRENMRVMRDFFSPETWSLINRLNEKIGSLAIEARSNPRRRRTLAMEGIGEALEGFPAFFGTAERTMLHDSGWHFLLIGVHLERAIMTCAGLRHGLSEAESAALDNRQEESDLTALVRILSSQDAYRRTYQARSEPLFVAELFLTHPAAPKSIRFCVRRISECLESALGPTGRDQEPYRLADASLRLLDQLDLESTFAQRSNSPRLPGKADRKARATSRSPTLAGTLETLRGRLNELGESLQDHFFSHHARVQTAEGGIPFIE